MAFPSPAQDYKGKTLSIDEYLIHRPDSSFFFEVINDAMIGDQISSKHKVVVDKAMIPMSGSIIVASLNGEFYIRRIRHEKGMPVLFSSNYQFPPIRVHEDDQFQIFGVVVGSFRRHL